jgi:haloacetate dehalogenase
VTPDHVHAICEEYRPAARIDREHDRADRKAGRRIARPGAVAVERDGTAWVVVCGRRRPLEPWRELGRIVTGHPVDGGHSFPEEHPRDMAEALAAFFAPDGD